MPRIRIIPIILLSALLASCACLNKAMPPAGTPSPSPVLSSAAIGGTASAESSASPSPATATSSPTVAPTPSPAVAPTPSPTPNPNAREFYIVQSNQRMGVVDGKGNVVLPVQFSKVEELFHTDTDAMFFAVRADAKPKDGSDMKAGEIYRGDGSKLSDDAYQTAYAINSDYIQVSSRNGEGFWRIGIMDHEGNMLVPCEYEDAYPMKYGFVGVKGESERISRIVDVYDKQGKLLRSASVNFRYADGEYISVSDDAGSKCGLMDSNFNVVVPAVWDDARHASNECFIVRRGELSGVIKSDGSQLMPLKFYDLYDMVDEQNNVTMFVAAAKDGVYLYDSQGKTLFYSAKYRNLQVAGGMLIASDIANRFYALDMGGKEIVPPAGYIFWHSETQLLICNYNDNGCDSFYTRDGAKLPLPKADSAQCLSRDRFIVGYNQQEGQLFGLCDGQGNIIVQPKYSQLYALQRDGLLVYAQADKTGTLHYGLMDSDGHVLLPPAYDVLYGDPDKSLLIAQLGMFHGLIDTKGNWVWYATEYDGLMD